MRHSASMSYMCPKFNCIALHCVVQSTVLYCITLRQRIYSNSFSLKFYFWMTWRGMELWTIFLVCIFWFKFVCWTFCISIAFISLRKIVCLPEYDVDFRSDSVKETLFQSERHCNDHITLKITKFPHELCNLERDVIIAMTYVIWPPWRFKPGASNQR